MGDIENLLKSCLSTEQPTRSGAENVIKTMRETDPGTLA